MSTSVHRERAHRFGAGFRGFDPGPGPSGSPKRFLICGTLLSFVSAVILMFFLIATLSDARAQDQANILNRGDAVVTGFSGIKPADAPLPEGSSPLDEFFIDLDGASAQILSFAAPGGAPSGQLMSAPALLQIKSREVGQVFATALDDGLGADVPNIYLGQTAAYGLHIVLPDADGDGWAERTKKGAAGAEWMAGQFGMATGGGPGAIYRIDGKTGVISLFASLPENSGAGVGDIVFDAATRQFFASDLDSGLIYRLNETGGVIDSFDHGVTGRPEDELPAVADDGSTVDIQNAAFDSEDPETWGFTQKERRVHGLAIRDGRLFYAVNGQVWSVGISEDGFAADASWELDAEALKSDGPVTDMLFDGEGRLYLAQRGGQRASYDYSVFAEPEKSSVVRYRREDPDDPATESVWMADPEEYAIGLPEEHRHAEGGIALGYSHDETGLLSYGSCGQMLWSTGHRLRPSAFAEEAAAGVEPEADIHGLQGNAVSLVRPENVPPQQSYFADYDGFFGDAAKSGHMGDVEIWQPCEGGAPTFGQFPPGIFIPGDTPPDDLPPEFPPEYEYETNLELTKWASPKECTPWFGGWLCQYRIRVRNTGPDNYFGPILIEDFLPANPAGAGMAFEPTPPWTCWKTGPSAHKCFRAGVFLAPGASVGLKAFAWVPKDYAKCNLRNVAAIEWAPGGTQWNTDPFDDSDDANALIPADHCKPGEKTDLRIEKKSLLPCFEANGGLRCGYKVTVENAGLGSYNGDIVIKDLVPANTVGIFSGNGWVCNNVNPSYTCTFANANLPNVGDTVSLIVRVDLPHHVAKQMNCKVPNKAWIIKAQGNTDQNTDPTNDSDGAVANVPQALCNKKVKNLKIEKRPLNDLCLALAGHWCNYWEVTLTNTGPAVNIPGPTVVEEILPAGLSFSTSTAGWNCAGNSCVHAAPLALGAGASSSFKVQVSGSAAQAKNMNCKLTNKVEISSPIFGSPVDDKAEATRNLPAQFCQEPNLKIEKRPLGDLCLALQGHWCNYWEITLTNSGPVDLNFAGATKIGENLPANVSSSTNTPGWNCSGDVCTHAAPLSLAKNGGSTSLKVQVSGSGDVAKFLGCKLTNQVKILTPQVGSEADDEDQATRDLPGQFCKEPVRNLKIEKRPLNDLCLALQGSWCNYWKITLTNTDDPLNFNGITVVQETLPDSVTFSTNTLGWTCGPHSCQHVAPISMAKGETMSFKLLVSGSEEVAKELNCELTNKVAILSPVVGESADDKAEASRSLPPLFCQKEKGPGGPDDETSGPSDAPSCPPGFNWNGENCDRIGISTPPPPSRDCPAGFTGKYPDCDRIVTPQPDPECPRGYVGEPPNCRRIVQPDPTPECTGGRVLRRGDCVCRRFRVWNGERCVRRQCPEGTRGVYPNCRKVVVDPPRCTGGRVLSRGKCVCRGSRVWNGKRCVRRSCPEGTRGVYPNCRKVVVDPPRCTGGRVLSRGKCVCRGSRVWNGNRCVRPRCPRGYEGRPPNCKKIVRTCPRGYVGKPPRCRKIERRQRRDFQLKRLNRNSDRRIAR